MSHTLTFYRNTTFILACILGLLLLGSGNPEQLVSYLFYGALFCIPWLWGLVIPTIIQKRTTPDVAQMLGPFNLGKPRLIILIELLLFFAIQYCFFSIWHFGFHIDSIQPSLLATMVPVSFGLCALWYLFLKKLRRKHHGIKPTIALIYYLISQALISFCLAVSLGLLLLSFDKEVTLTATVSLYLIAIWLLANLNYYRLVSFKAILVISYCIMLLLLMHLQETSPNQKLSTTNELKPLISGESP